MYVVIEWHCLDSIAHYPELTTPLEHVLCCSYPGNCKPSDSLGNS